MIKSTKSFVLNSSEEIFADLRDKNFNAVGPTLSKKAKAISAQFDERHGARTVRDLKLFVDKMPQMQVKLTGGSITLFWKIFSTSLPEIIPSLTFLDY